MEGDAETSPKPESPKTPGRGRKRKTTGTDSAKKTPEQAEARKRLRPRKSRDLTFPKTLEGFEYKFNDDGELRHMESGEPFDFNALEDEESNQKRFEALAEVIAEHVYDLLESECELEKQTFPIEPKKSDMEGFFFTSSDALTNEDKLLILISGAETSRAGQWSTKVVIEEGLNAGSQIPYIKKAKELGYGIMVFNPNQNSVLNKFNAPTSIRGNENPDKHCDYIWKNFVKDAQAKNIALIAASQGGASLLKMAQQNVEDFQKRVFAIALADSTHQITKPILNKALKTKIVKIGKNFVPSDEQDIGEEVPGGRALDITMESVGDMESSMVTCKCLDSIFEFVLSRLDAIPAEESPKPKKSPKKKRGRAAQQEEEEEEKKVEEVEEEKEKEESKENEVEEKEEEKEETETDKKDEEVEEKEEEKEEEEEMETDDKSEKDEKEKKEVEEEKKDDVESEEEKVEPAAENDTKSEEEEESKEETNKSESNQNSDEKMEVDKVEQKDESPKKEEKEKTVNGTEVEIDDGEKLNDTTTDEKMKVEGATKMQDHQEIKTVTTAEPQTVREDV